ncbi:hypothetical protein OTB20_34225 [Streptomyces sp. H27-H1]|uniref:hypothetical protein n=1 Tax=unclassified Streptomyces TaxID=2593676 RepID=UPI0022713016|nr:MULTISPECIES: hypothetical protein [unclassified Streptomyces]MCY0931153.1 hypothetical protein [Streptomyces sp. H27-H1]MCY0939252.1 hypothetical protein [Streptomyces sp. H34-S4]
MGAITFFEVAAGDDAAEAFNEKRNEAQHEHGCGGDSGTIAEKDDYVVFDEPRRSEAFAIKRAHDLVNAGDPRIDDKWGPAGALPITTSTAQNGWLFFGWAND